MKKPFIGHSIVFLKSVDSTNIYAYNAFKSGEIDSGTVVIADFQTKGKGQRNKIWHAESGLNLLASITADLNLWKIENMVSLNHIVALSLQRFLLQYTNNVCIKWPNDIMVNNQKMAGILIQTQMSSTYKKAIIGFGININQESFDAPRATSLFKETLKKFDPKSLIHEIIIIMNELISEYQINGEDYCYHIYNQQLWKLNQNHPFEIDGTTKMGKVISVTREGQLIIRHSGTDHYYSNGEVKY